MTTKKKTNPEADIVDDAASDEPVRHMQGLRTVLEALRLEDFPMNKHEIDYSVGDIDIEDGHEGFIAVNELTDHILEDTFNTPEEVIHALKMARKKIKKSAA